MGEMRLTVRWSPSSGLRPHDLMATVLSLRDGGRVEATREVAVEMSRALTARTDLPDGAYMVQVGLPSGELLREWFEVTGQEPTDVVLRAKGRPRGSDLTRAASQAPTRLGVERAERRSRIAQGGYGASVVATERSSPDEIRGPSSATSPAIIFLRQPATCRREAWSTMCGTDHGREVVHVWSDPKRPVSGLRTKVSAQGDLRIYSRIELDQGEPERLWAVAANADGLVLASLPLPWPSQRDGHQAPVYLPAGDRRADLRAVDLSVSVADGTLGGLLEYLGHGRLDGAAKFLGEVDISALVLGNGVRKNPLGACAGAYVGLATLDIGETPPWLVTLPEMAALYSWLPDAAILAACRLYREETVDVGALSSALTAAFARGIPYFTTGLIRMREMLWSCASRDDSLRELLDAVTCVASRMDAGKVFTTLRYPRSSPGGTPGVAT